MTTVSYKAKTSDTKEIRIPDGLKGIETLAREYAKTRGDLAALAGNCANEIEEIKANYLPELRLLSASLTRQHLQLAAHIRSNADQFKAPRTRVFHGIKLGLQKLVGKLIFADEDRTVTLIKKHFPEQFDVLISTTLSLNRAAISTLPALDLKRVGGEVQDTDDQVVIKPIAGDVEKLVAGLLADKKSK